MQELTDLLLDLISLIFILSSIILSFIVGGKSYRVQQKNKNIQNKIFTVTAFSLGVAMILLTIEQLFLTLIKNDPLGLLFGGIATVVSGIVVVSIDAFAFSMAFSKKYKILTVISAILMSLPILFHLFDPTKGVIEGEIEFTWDPLYIGFPITPLIMYVILIPLLIIPVLVFWYYGSKIRSQSKFKSNRAILLGVGILFVSLAYIFELVGLPVIIVFFRSFYLIGGILIYYAMFKVKE
ncbi:MAG: hypothetical protein ACTSQO_00410 [Candidatus Helarchaeota archaeon]